MKPKIKLASLKYLCEIDRYIQQYKPERRYLQNSASDVLDGAVDREEIDDLVRRRLLSVIHYHDDEDWQPIGLCGSSWSVHLTDRAIQCFWPTVGRRKNPRRSR